MTFVGFSNDAIRFFAELAENNDTAWFEAHRAEYQALVLEPSKAFVVALGPRLRELDPKIQAIPKLHGSIKTVERRMRFPKSDVPPYKDYLDIWFWSGRRRAWKNSGFFLRLTSTRLTLAAGMVEFQKEALGLYRRDVLDQERGRALAAIVDDLRAQGLVVGGESTKKPPRGVAADHPRAALSKHGGLFAVWEGEHPKEFAGSEFLEFAFTRFSRMAPLHTWLVGLRA